MGHARSGEMHRPQYIYEARVIGVVDGMTLDVDVDLGFCRKHRCQVFLAGVRYPVQCEASPVPATAATQALRELVHERPVVLRVFKDRRFRSDFWFVNVFVEVPEGTQVCVNEVLIERGVLQRGAD